MIVFDASTLILIAKAELLDRFLATVGVPVAVPAEVERECCGSKKSLDAAMIQKAIERSLIKSTAVRNRRQVVRLQEDFSLGLGEAEAIALAAQAKAQVLAIDDKNGINACKLLGIPFTTALNILLRSREKGLLEVSEALEKLARLAHFGRYKHSILEDARRRLEAMP